jgi:FlaA1/EpsC-like NDP-sugar epimerase
MRKISTLWRDLKIVIKAVWLNLLLFAGVLAGAVALLRSSGAYPQANWLYLLVNALHMAVLERVAQPGDGLMPAVLTFLLPLLTVIILGEGALRVLTVFIARGEHREEWDMMVAKTYTNHIVICGVGELGKALVKRIHADHPEARIVLIDLRPGLLTETGLSGDNVICLQSDMTSIETLKKVNCHKARLVLLASGNDAFNLEAAYKVQQLNPQTETWVRLHHSGLADLMDLSRKPNLHFFSPYQQAAEVIAGHLLHEEKIDK